MNLTIHDLFPSRFLRGEDLEGKKFVLTIEKITVEEMGKEKEKHPVLWFKGAKKGLVLRKTNAFIIGKLYGPELPGWIGKRIQLYSKKQHAFGADQTIICVAEFVPPEPAPKQAPAPAPEPEVEFPGKAERQAAPETENPWDEEGGSDDDIPY